MFRSKPNQEMPLNNTVALSFELAKKGVGPADIAKLDAMQIEALAAHIARLTQENNWKMPDSDQLFTVGARQYKFHKVLFVSVQRLFTVGEVISNLLHRRGITQLGQLLALGYDGVIAMKDLSPNRARSIHNTLTSIGLGLHPIPDGKKGQLQFGRNGAIPVYTDYAALMFPFGHLVIIEGEYSLWCRRLKDIKKIDDLFDISLDDLAQRVFPEIRRSREHPLASNEEPKVIGRNFARRLMEMAGFVDNFRALQ